MCHFTPDVDKNAGKYICDNLWACNWDVTGKPDFQLIVPLNVF
jgi:hypothetical protein